MLPDNDTGISMTPLDEHEQNTQFGAGRAAMLATRPAVQGGSGAALASVRNHTM